MFFGKSNNTVIEVGQSTTVMIQVPSRLNYNKISVMTCLPKLCSTGFELGMLQTRVLSR
jgi:hypothetical protein